MIRIKSLTSFDAQHTGHYVPINGAKAPLIDGKFQKTETAHE